MSAIVATCSCDETFTASQWHELPQPTGGEWMEDGDGGWLQLRNCRKCGSTRAIEVARDRCAACAACAAVCVRRLTWNY